VLILVLIRRQVVAPTDMSEFGYADARFMPCS
jgi:hypothetical protein